MAQQNIIDVFEDCISRRAAGQSIDDCLRVYPAHAQRLLPLLEAGEDIRVLQPSRAELLEDQVLVWREIQAQMPKRLAVVSSISRRGSRMVLQLLAAVLLLLALMAATWFVLTRPDLPDQENIVVPILSTGTPTATVTATTSPTPTLMLTVIPSVTYTPMMTSTVSITATEAATVVVSKQAPLVVSTPVNTPTPPPTTPTATFAPGCGAPLTEDAARARVLEIYPSTTITSIQQVTKFGGTLVWEVHTTHGIEVNVDVACGTILTIEREGASSGTGSGSGTSGGSGGTTNGSGNDNEDGASGGSSGSGNDNSGTGSGNDNEDNSGPGSGDDDNANDNDDNSGPGSGDDDNSGPGSGDDDDD